MINLLPPKEQEELKLEAKKKLVMVLGNVVIVSLICFFLVLLSLKFYILGEIVSQKAILDYAERQYQTEDFLFFKQIMEKYNKVLVKIDSFYKKKANFSHPLKYILEIQKSDGLYFTDINMDKVREDNKIKVSIHGISDTRDNLLTLKNNIENSLSLNLDQSKGIKNVYFPPNNWIKSKNINFHFTFDYQNN